MTDTRVDIYELLADTTAQYRKGEVFEGTPELVEQAKRGDDLKGRGVLNVYAMPKESEAPAGTELVDMIFVKIGVDKTKALARKAELIDWLNRYPHPERLAAGPSYIEVGAEIGDQGAAFQLFALGKILGLWDVITPATFGLTGAEAANAAGSGYIMITGYRGERP